MSGKTCYSCMKEIDYLATRCPHCTAEYQSPYQPLSTGTEILIIACIVIVTFFYWLFSWLAHAIHTMLV